jgi:hypothetical protein
MFMRLPNAPQPPPAAPPEPHSINHEYYQNANRNTVWQLHDWPLQRFCTIVRMWRGVEPNKGINSYTNNNRLTFNYVASHASISV